MERDRIPQSAYSNDVHIGNLNVDDLYRQHIDSLNATTPTPEKATRLLAMHLMRDDDSLWDELVAAGEAGDTNHELRALVVIARGDQRLMGDIYDAIRRQVKPLIDETDLRKAGGTARTYDPNSAKKSYFF
jgi:hypothetical protein